MPFPKLNENSSNKARRENVTALIHEGYPPKTAMAIAYDKQKKWLRDEERSQTKKQKKVKK